MSADRVDVIGNLRMALQHVVLCAPDDVVQKLIEESIAAVNLLINVTADIARRAAPHPDDTNKDLKRNLLFVRYIADLALSRIAQPGDSGE